MVKQKIVVSGFRHAESISGIYCWLTLLLEGILGPFQFNFMMVLAVFL